MKEESKLILNKINSSRTKIYYKLGQLVNITGMSIRNLKYRMKIVKEKYRNIPFLLFKNGRSWQIHYTLIPDFLPIYKQVKTNITNHKWETILTWNTKDSYDENYHVQLIKEVNKQLPTVNVGYVIERDKRGICHLHAITDGDIKIVEVAVNNVLNKYIERKLYRYQIEYINNMGSITTYLQKGGEIIIL